MGPDPAPLTLPEAATALDVPPTDLAVHLAHLGVDARYLGHALLEEDPDEVLPELADRLGRAPRALVLDLAEVVALPPDHPLAGGWGGVDAAALRGVLPDPLVDALDEGRGPPRWAVDIVNPFAPHRETRLDDLVHRLNRWNRGLTVGGVLLALLLGAAGVGALLWPGLAGAVLWHALAATLLVGAVATVAGVAAVSGFVSGHADRARNLRSRLGDDPGEVVVDMVERAGLDDAARREAMVHALTAAKRWGGHMVGPEDEVDVEGDPLAPEVEVGVTGR